MACVAWFSSTTGLIISTVKNMPTQIITAEIKAKNEAETTFFEKVSPHASTAFWFCMAVLWYSVACLFAFSALLSNWVRISSDCFLMSSKVPFMHSAVVSLTVCVCLSLHSDRLVLNASLVNFSDSVSCSTSLCIEFNNALFC